MDQRFAVPGVAASTPLAEAAPALLLAKAEPLFALEAAARSGADADAVHDMRVASRRLRETMRLLAVLYPDAEFAKWYRLVRGVTRALGPVRDSDVFIDDFSRLAADLGEGGRRAVAFLVGMRMGGREGELAALNRELARLDLSASERSLRKLAHKVARTPAAKRPLAEFAHAAVAERAAVVFGALPDALPEANVLDQHALRIDFKRLRYAVEVFAPAYADAFDGLHDTLTAFQDTLGDLHDLHVFLEMVADPALAGAARQAGVSAGDLGEVVALLEARAQATFLDFVRLAAEHPASDLLAELLLPLATRPEPSAPDAHVRGAASVAAPEGAAAAVVLASAVPIDDGAGQVDPASQPWRSDAAGLAIEPPIVIGAEPWARPAVVPAAASVPTTPDDEEPS